MVIDDSYEFLLADECDLIMQHMFLLPAVL